MSSAQLTVKFLQILITEFAKMVLKGYKNVRYYIQLQIVTNKLSRFTYNSEHYRNNVVTATLFKFLAMYYCMAVSPCKPFSLLLGR